jgi:cellulose synthase/poly-beta-1,6-N-acetylglucosamine synthase-like glycosyltransferase
MKQLGIILFAVGLGGTAYFTYGYPLLLAALARWHPRAIHKKFEPIFVTVLLPVHNGERWIASKINSILELDYPRSRLQVVVVSDGSTDATDSIAADYAREGHLEFVRIEHAGKAVALNEGIRRARGDVLFFTDVRQPLRADSLRKLVACLADPSVGGAAGRVDFLGGTERPHIGLYWRYERWLRRNLSRVDSLLAANCIYVVRRNLVEAACPDTLLDDSWFPLGCVLRGYRFILEEEAIAYEYPNTLQSEFVRKMRTLAGIYQLIAVCPALLGRSNRLRFHFVSYVLGRVLLPFLLLITLFASFSLPSPVRTTIMTLFISGIGLAFLDLVVPAATLIKRVTSPVRTFVVLMAASLCATSIFFVPPGSLWKDAWQGES